MSMAQAGGGDAGQAVEIGVPVLGVEPGADAAFEGQRRALVDAEDMIVGNSRRGSLRHLRKCLQKAKTPARPACGDQEAWRFRPRRASCQRLSMDILAPEDAETAQDQHVGGREGRGAQNGDQPAFPGDRGPAKTAQAGSKPWPLAQRRSSDTSGALRSSSGSRWRTSTDRPAPGRSSAPRSSPRRRRWNRPRGR